MGQIMINILSEIRRLSDYKLLIFISAIPLNLLFLFLFYSPSFNAVVRGDHLQIYGKALRFLKLESSRQSSVKI